MTSDALWTRLLSINRMMERAYRYITMPLVRFSQNLITRLPRSKLWFRPLFLHDVYMALGLWEPYVRREFMPRLGDVVVDVGAHIGYYTMIAAKAVGPDGVVVSVEPDPRNFEILRKNVALSELWNVVLVNCALGSSTGRIAFKMATNPLYSEIAKVGPCARSAHTTVKIRPLNHLCRSLGIETIDWIKIDVEGGASDVLRGGSEVLDSGTTILIEVPDDETFGLLDEMGYSTSPLLHSGSKYGYYRASRKTAQHRSQPRGLEK